MFLSFLPAATRSRTLPPNLQGKALPGSSRSHSDLKSSSNSFALCCRIGSHRPKREIKPCELNQLPISLWNGRSLSFRGVVTFAGFDTEILSVSFDSDRAERAVAGGV
jgi:hypothetical protein